MKVLWKKLGILSVNTMAETVTLSEEVRKRKSVTKHETIKE